MSHAGGLLNLGGTCYLNSILQLIRASGVLTQSTFKDDSPLAHNLHSVCEALNSGKNVAPRELLHLMQTRAGPQFQLRQPNDLHEFYVTLIDWLTTNTMEPIAPPSLRTIATRSAWTSCLKGNGSILTPSFYGMMRKTVRCEKCDACYVNFETFSALSIDLINGDDNGTVSLNTLLAATFADHNLNADGGTWKCDQCGVVGEPAIASTVIERAPDIFTFAFNRYAGTHCKLGVTFPKTFAIQIKQHTKQYTCAGAAMHIGGATGGHCFASTPRSGDDRWAIYDDDVVKDIAVPPSGNPAVHILMYTRSNIKTNM